jgi:hypothetical protein
VLQTFLELYLFSQAPHTPAKKRLEVFFERHAPDQYATDVLKALDEEFYQSFTAQNAYETLERLGKAFDELPSIVLYVPIAFPVAHTKDIGMWLRKNTQQRMLVKMIVEPDIAAGGAIVKDGVYYDFSFRYFLRAREAELLATIHEHAYAS